ncbi:hypothetical protein ACF0H5_017443 [Mactra antiquata]
MARGRNKRTIIQVQSAPTTNVVFNLVDLSTENTKNVTNLSMLPKLIEVAPLLDEKSIDDSLATRSESAEDFVTTMQQITPREENHNKRIEDAFIEVELKMEGPADNVNEVLNPDLMIVGKKIEEEIHTEESEKKIKKRKKKNQKKKKKEKKEKNADKPDSEVTDKSLEITWPVRLKPIKKVVEPSTNVPQPVTTPKLKPLGCFGFVSTWLAKRKEKRREKKRNAINARKEANTEPLVEYEHRRAKGGLAFTVEIDSRPIMKSVLPPIKQRPGPIRMATEQKLEQADNNRAEHINKRRENARAHSRMAQEVADRRIENEMIFKQTTLLKIKDKEFKASRAPSRLEYDRNMRCQSRCKSRMRHTPDMFTSKVEITLSSSPIAEVNEMPTISPLSSGVPLHQYFTVQDISYRVEE